MKGRGVSMGSSPRQGSYSSSGFEDGHLWQQKGEIWDC